MLPDDSASRPGAASPAPVLIGVLGGIASGKSAVAALLAGQEGSVIAADALAHEALRAPEVVARVREAFGAGVLGPDGQVDRPTLGAIVFDDAEARARLEAWIHPWVRGRILALIEEARVAGRPRVVLDVPLLLENDAEHGLARRCDHLVFVEVSDAERDRRAVQTRGWEPGEVARRERAQLPLTDKRARADVVVQNDGTLADLEAAVRDARDVLGV